MLSPFEPSIYCKLETANGQTGRHFEKDRIIRPGGSRLAPKEVIWQLLILTAKPYNMHLLQKLPFTDPEDA